MSVVFIRSLNDGSFIFLLMYVDDMFIASNHLHDINELKMMLEMSLTRKT